MFLIAAEPVDAFGHDHIKMAKARLPHQVLIGWAQMRGARKATVTKDRSLNPAFVLDQAAAKAQLILNGSVALQFCGEPRVDGCAHHAVMLQKMPAGSAADV